MRFVEQRVSFFPIKERSVLLQGDNMVKQRVLVVSSSSELRRMYRLILSRIMKNIGYDDTLVLEADSSAKAIGLVNENHHKQTPITLIFVQMSEYSLDEKLFEHLQVKDAPLPVFIITADNSPQVYKLAKKYRIEKERIFSLPLSFPLLSTKLRKILNRD